MKKLKQSKHAMWIVFNALLLGMIALSLSLGTISYMSRAEDPTQKQGILSLITPIPTQLPVVDQPAAPTNIPRVPNPLPPPQKDITPQPRPIPKPEPSGNICAPESAIVNNCTCPGEEYRVMMCPLGKYKESGFFKTDAPTNIVNPDSPDWAAANADPECRPWCIAKPVIYLYPTLPTYVSVRVDVPGDIVVSDPLYPAEGWRDVLAQPNGVLTYQDNQYNELFYEAGVDAHITPPHKGFVIPRSSIGSTLRGLVKRLGLRGREVDEFVAYWEPELLKLNTPYIFFSVIDPVTKEKIDSVHINPKPDTFIAFIAYFRALPQIIAAEPLDLPQQPPERKGFTAVEWGGTIDQSPK